MAGEADLCNIACLLQSRCATRGEIQLAMWSQQSCSLIVRGNCQMCVAFYKYCAEIRAKIGHREKTSSKSSFRFRSRQRSRGNRRSVMAPIQEGAVHFFAQHYNYERAGLT